jgi:hypothetical protein
MYASRTAHRRPFPRNDCGSGQTASEYTGAHHYLGSTSDTQVEYRIVPADQTDQGQQLAVILLRFARIAKAVRQRRGALDFPGC